MLWWATLGVIAIEGTVFALMITSYLYLKGRKPHWPPGVLPPRPVVGHAEHGRPAGLAACPNQLAKRAAERVRPSQECSCGWSVCVAVRRSPSTSSASSSSGAERVVGHERLRLGRMGAARSPHHAHPDRSARHDRARRRSCSSDRSSEKRFVDVSENAFYWYFVVLAWLPIYALIYFAPRVA